MQQVKLHDTPGKVAVTCWELQYYSNLHKNKPHPLTKLEVQKSIYSLKYHGAL